MYSQTLLLHLLLLLVLYVLSSIPLSLSQTNYYRYSNCQPVPYSCGKIHFNLQYPFELDGSDRPGYCGHPDFHLTCINNNSTLLISINGLSYQVTHVDVARRALTLVAVLFVGQECPQLIYDTTFASSDFQYTDDDVNLTVYFNCTEKPTSASMLYTIECLSEVAPHPSYYALYEGGDSDAGDKCSSVTEVPINRTAAEKLMKSNSSFGDALREGFELRWIIGSGWCGACIESGGVCGYNASSPRNPTCFCRYGSFGGSCPAGDPVPSTSKKGRVIGISVAAVGSSLLCMLCFVIYIHKKRGKRSPSRELHPSDAELGSNHYQTHVFSYDELEEATDGFHASKELGDGGFGTVYRGKLRDGRTVAVKRLYENNYKRVEQFMNEVGILSRLRHQNLVSLYGCTSRRSRELLLVYELIPNGTVADHLHGPFSLKRALTWPIRIRIAVETADALAYLHAVDPPIVHRDIKTNNILLDASFHVKVADFGLSRLFPTNATHVSTAPQGTPGYVDPEYHKCYQLTDKSDVYSFGVVLVELISSKPAVDITRSRDEINLANLAVRRIQKCELEQLVDPELGYDSDSAVKKMITMVAELAFRCLQPDGDMRPPIREVLELLKGIEEEGYKVEGDELGDDIGGEGDCAGFSKKTAPFSPDSVTHQWESWTTTPNTSK
ncbi:LEAF RUST 10 DISEASE-RESISTANCEUS RECEPTOR-LIKE PROTEIN KINASE-like 1.2 [Typha latifolia]|uniref:LEAF RUST 10 DISEASE-RESISTANCEUS RECEPTOR-LIKE PROTEIN KINASE-like 1.2 n=1 Tax=Typha latifolia TaxID=4733 RepID=UPI003C2E57DB